MRKVVRRSDPKSLDVTSQLPSEDSADRKHFIFYQDEGGFRATDDANQALDTIYYLGVIDICTPYNTLKKIEHFWKSMTEDRVSFIMNGKRADAASIQSLVSIPFSTASDSTIFSDR